MQLWPLSMMVKYPSWVTLNSFWHSPGAPLPCAFWLLHWLQGKNLDISKNWSSPLKLPALGMLDDIWVRPKQGESALVNHILAVLGRKNTTLGHHQWSFDGFPLQIPDWMESRMQDAPTPAGGRRQAPQDVSKVTTRIARLEMSMANGSEGNDELTTEYSLDLG